MLIYYTGEGSRRANPECVLGDEATIMMSYFDFHKTGKPTGRFKTIIKKRREKKKRKRSK